MLGEIGEDVKIRIEEPRLAAVESIDKARRALKWNKYALQAMANVYEGTEERIVQEVVDSWTGMAGCIEPSGRFEMLRTIRFCQLEITARLPAHSPRPSV